jgi:hypothetical protein
MTGSRVMNDQDLPMWKPDEPNEKGGQPAAFYLQR